MLDDEGVGGGVVGEFGVVRALAVRGVNLGDSELDFCNGGADEFLACRVEGCHFLVEPVLEVFDFVADELGVGEVGAHFGGDGVGFGDAETLGFAFADGNDGAAAVPSEGGIVLFVFGGEDLAFEGTVSVSDAVVFAGGVLPVGEGVFDVLEFCPLADAIGETGFVVVDEFCLPGVEAGVPEFVEERPDGFLPLLEALALGECLGEAFFEGGGKIGVGDDGAGEGFKVVEGGGVAVAEAEGEVDGSGGCFEGVGGVGGLACGLGNPFGEALGSPVPGVVHCGPECR